VTLGLSFSRVPQLFRAIIDALDGLEVNAIVTVGLDLDPAVVGAVPANVRVERYIAAGLLLPHCAAIVFHGGFNTLHAALWHGLPSVVVPLEGGDQGVTAERLEELGAGIHVPGPLPSAAELRSAIGRLLDERGYAISAADLGRQMQALPQLDEAVGRLEALTADGGP
jgi:MGT family glycosyltransferase